MVTWWILKNFVLKLRYNRLLSIFYPYVSFEKQCYIHIHFPINSQSPGVRIASVGVALSIRRDLTTQRAARHGHKARRQPVTTP